MHLGFKEKEEISTKVSPQILLVTWTMKFSHDIKFVVTFSFKNYNTVIIKFWAAVMQKWKTVSIIFYLIILNSLLYFSSTVCHS